MRRAAARAGAKPGSVGRASARAGAKPGLMGRFEGWLV